MAGGFEKSSRRRVAATLQTIAGMLDQLRDLVDGLAARTFELRSAAGPGGELDEHEAAELAARLASIAGELMELGGPLEGLQRQVWRLRDGVLGRDE